MAIPSAILADDLAPPRRFSLATATAIISRPSSVLPIEKTFTRGVDFSSSRMYS